MQGELPEYFGKASCHGRPSDRWLSYHQVAITFSLPHLLLKGQETKAQRRL